MMNSQNSGNFIAISQIVWDTDYSTALYPQKVRNFVLMRVLTEIKIPTIFFRKRDACSNEDQADA